MHLDDHFACMKHPIFIQIEEYMDEAVVEIQTGPVMWIPKLLRTCSSKMVSQATTTITIYFASGLNRVCFLPVLVKANVNNRFVRLRSILLSYCINVDVGALPHGARYLRIAA